MTERRINHLTRTFIAEMSRKGRPVGLSNCSICNEPMDLKTAKTDEDGKGVHEECYVDKIRRDLVTSMERNALCVDRAARATRHSLVRKS
jgi:hypothetical protein